MMTEFPETRGSLLAQVQSPENQEAWTVFAATYQPAIYRMARRRGMQDADALDLVQDVLVRVAGSIARYELQEGVRFRNWLGRVARNTILTALTRTPPHVGEGGTAAMDKLRQHPEPDQSVDQELEREIQREQWLRAAAAVRRDVNEETWQAFSLTTREGLSCEDAAQQLKKSIGTIYAARSRVLKRMRDYIEDFMGAEH